MTILDVGCGKGEPMGFINRHKQYYTVGLDIFRPYLEECKRQRIHDEYIQCDVRCLPVRDKSSDVVLCTEVLEHMEHEDGRRLLCRLEDIAIRQVILTTPLHHYVQDEYDSNPYQKHQYIWSSSELKELGYQVKMLGFRRLRGQEGLSSFLPGLLRLFSDMVWVIAGPVTQFFPTLAGHMVCIKRF